jgi:hypothetical protein
MLMSVPGHSRHIRDVCAMSASLQTSDISLLWRNRRFWATYKGKHVDVKQVGRDPVFATFSKEVFQRGTNRLRVNVQLIDAETGTHLWAERSDKPVSDLLDMQGEIVARLANTLNAELIAIEARHAEQAPNPDSMDFYFHGMAWVNRGVNPEHFAKGARLFRTGVGARSRQRRRAGGP